MRFFLRIIVMFVVGLAAFWSMPSYLNAQSLNKAALVIRHDDQEIQTACVSFAEPQISGLDLISRANLGLEIDVQGGGTLVCKVGDTGCSAGDCWCQCKGGGDCIYWSYWHNEEADWNYSQFGAGAHIVKNGSIDGWSWGPGAVDEAVPPPDITFDDVCRLDVDNPNDQLDQEPYQTSDPADQLANLDSSMGKKVKTASEPQQMLLEEGLNVDENMPSNSLEINPIVAPAEKIGWLRYAGFLVIISGLSLFLLRVKKK